MRVDETGVNPRDKITKLFNPVCLCPLMHL
jgi:hypothetical protein